MPSSAALSGSWRSLAVLTDLARDVRRRRFPQPEAFLAGAFLTALCTSLRCLMVEDRISTPGRAGICHNVRLCAVELSPRTDGHQSRQRDQRHVRVPASLFFLPWRFTLFAYGFPRVFLGKGLGYITAGYGASVFLGHISPHNQLNVSTQCRGVETSASVLPSGLANSGNGRKHAGACH